MKGLFIGRVFIVGFVVLVIHIGLAPDLRIVGVAAELPLGLTIASGLAGGVERGAVHGLIYGLIVDMFLFTPVGLSALVFAVIGWLSGHVYLDRLEESPLVSTVTIALGTAASIGVFIALGLMLGESSLLEAPIGTILLVAPMINAALAVPLVAAAHWMWTADPLHQGTYG